MTYEKKMDSFFGSPLPDTELVLSEFNYKYRDIYFDDDKYVTLTYKVVTDEGSKELLHKQRSFLARI